MQRYVRMAEQTDADIVVANYARLWNGKITACSQPCIIFPDIIEILRNFSFAASFSAGTLSYVLGKTLSQIVSGKESDPFCKI